VPTPQGPCYAAPPMRDALCRFVVPAALVAAPRLAIAGPDASLEVTRGPGAEQCPDAAALGAAAEHLARIRLFVPGPSSTRLTVAVSHDDSGYHATIVAYGAVTGSREFTSYEATCTELADKVAFALTVLLEPDVPDPAPGSAPAPAPTEPASVPPRPLPVTPRPARWHRLEWKAGVGVGVEAGLLDHMGLLERVLVQGGPAPWSVSLSAFRLTDQTVHLSPGEVQLGLVAGALGGCIDPTSAPSLSVCAQFAVGRLRAEAQGYDHNEAASELWLAIGPSARLSSGIHGPLAWMVAVEGFWSLRRSSFGIEGLDRRESTSPGQLGATATAGLLFAK
jgi:hypothetical protein